jgi:hypothetical protein
MATLKEEHQIFIAQQLGYYRSPVQIIESVKDRFGVDVEKQQIYYYQQQIGKDDTNIKPRTEMLKKIFLDARQEFKDKKVEIGISFQSFRLQVLQDLLMNEMQKPAKNRNDNKIMQILEQAAKEDGLHYTNRRDITSGGKPLSTPEEIAQKVFNDLIIEAGWSAEDAMRWVANRYQIDAAKLVSNAVN